jgi:hypothetical protein
VKQPCFTISLYFASSARGRSRRKIDKSGGDSCKQTRKGKTRRIHMNEFEGNKNLRELSGSLSDATCPYYCLSGYFWSGRNFPANGHAGRTLTSAATEKVQVKERDGIFPRPFWRFPQVFCCCRPLRFGGRGRLVPRFRRRGNNRSTTRRPRRGFTKSA